MKTLALPVLVGAAWLSVLQAQAPTPTFRAGVDVVRVDAVVVDAKGMPIRGLKAEDFTVLEDGQERPIVGFEAIDIPDALPAGPGEASWVRSAPRDVVTNRLEDRRLFMIVIDDAMMPSDVRAIARAKSIANDVVSRLGADDQAAVVFTMQSKKSQIFTGDRVRLRAAIDATRFGGLENSATGSAWTLANAVTVLKSAPQPRKTLVFISAGVGLSGASLAPAMSSMSASGISGSEGARRILDELNRIITAAANANVNVYAFDVHDMSFVTGDPPMPDLNSPQRDYLRTVASVTGGRAFIGDDDPVEGVTRMLRESSTYYLLGFSPSSGRPGRHRLDIRTTRSGAKVLSRSDFEIANAASARVKAETPTASLVSGLMPVDGLPMRVAVTALPGAASKDAMVAVTLGINQPAEGLTGEPERMTAQIDAYQSGGKFVRATKLDARLTLKPTASGRAQYDLLGKLPLPPGRYQLRIAAHSPRLDIRGSVFVDVDVPDFSRDELTVAPLVLSTNPAPPAAPADAFVGLLPVIPTSHRSFGVADRVSILARVVKRQGRATTADPLAMEVTVVNSQGRRVFGRSEPATPGPNGVTDYAFELPMATLPIGDYLLTVKASGAGKTDEKTARFSRR